VNPALNIPETPQKPAPNAACTPLGSPVRVPSVQALDDLPLDLMLRMPSTSSSTDTHSLSGILDMDDALSSKDQMFKKVHSPPLEDGDDNDDVNDNASPKPKKARLTLKNIEYQ
jgi:hypothetical protein